MMMNNNLLHHLHHHLNLAVPIQKTNPIPNKEDLSEENTLEIAFEVEEEEEQIEIKRSEFQEDSLGNGVYGRKKKICGNKQKKVRNICK
ncbi:MAG: hypothetical protein EZS28_007730 [Streblomastix strix]|uniref:Uncharacterized protein n=1 Tax=Streblomastix strix TaxID=222440 RepID=A0A5J4WQN4_9EUKA|nr:MAG: hypothetical protein EZS28_007730 [Streblomastix strix]